MNIKHTSFVFLAFSILASSCSIEKQIHKQALQFFINDSTLSKAHVGIAIQDLEKKEWLYQFQSDKLFTPASNTKIVSCYAAMKHLPSHLPAAIVTDLDTALLIALQVTQVFYTLSLNCTHFLST